MPSFDIVSTINKHEVTNAVDQANREVGTRFDFKGSDASYNYSVDKITLKCETDFQLKQMLDILHTKLAKRQIDLAHLETAEPVIQHKNAQQVITLKEGINQETAKKIVKMIKDKKMKVQAAIQGDQVRVTGKKKDDLQEVIAMLRKENVGIPLQFENFRE